LITHVRFIEAEKVISTNKEIWKNYKSLFGIKNKKNIDKVS